MIKELLLAATKGDLKKVEELLSLGAKIESIGEDNETALIRAAENGHTATVEFLLKRKADVAHQDKEGCSALIGAAEDGHTATVELLLKRKADVAHQDTEGTTALLLPAFNGHIATVKLLLKHKADIKHENKLGTFALLCAAVNGHTSIAKLLLRHKANIAHQNKEGWSSLLCAAQNGHIAIVELLLKRKANIDHQNRADTTALTLAAQFGHTAVVELLLKRKARIAHQNPRGYTAFLYTAMNGHTSVAKLLLKHNADITHQSKKGTSALLLAAQNGHTSTAKWLLKHNADITHQDQDGWSALLCVAENGHISTLKLLLQYKADITHQSKKGSSALILAALNGHTATVELLLKYKADLAHQDKNGLSVLHCAAKSSHAAPVVLCLLNQGAFIDILLNNGKTPRQYIEQEIEQEGEKLQIVKLLKKAETFMKCAVQNKEAKEFTEVLKVLGKGINGRRINDANTALHILTLHKNRGAVEALLEAGADIDMPNNKQQSPLDLARQIDDSYILLLFLIQLIKQTCELFENIDIQLKSREAKVTTRKVESLLKQALDILETLEDLDKQKLAFKLGCFLASPEANPINATVAYNLLRKISEKVGLEYFRQANFILFKLLMGKKVRLQDQTTHKLENPSSKKIVAYPGGGSLEEKEDGENGELRLRYEIEFGLNSGQSDEIVIKKLMAEYCLGPEKSMSGIEGVTGPDTKTVLVLAERLRHERIARAREKEELLREKKEKIEAQAEVEQLRAELKLKTEQMEKAMPQNSTTEAPKTAEESEDPGQRISAARKAAKEMRSLKPAGPLPQAHRSAKRNASQAELQTPETSLIQSKRTRPKKTAKHA